MSEKESARSVKCAVVTISDTRTEETDVSGARIAELLAAEGHEVVTRKLLKEDPKPMLELFMIWRDRPAIEAILVTGGTGLNSTDQTYETMNRLFDRKLPGYGELLRKCLFDKIGPLAMSSRATGGLMGETVLLSIPGQPEAAEYCLKELILPTLSHLVSEARR
jgi:molybdenum cofactor biosynthesis protein B